MNNLSITIALFAGLVSFLSPCVLPILPGFLAYLAGTSVKNEKSQRREIFLASLFFVLGFSTVFSILGVILNTLLGNLASDLQMWLSRIGGILIIIFGLFLTGLLHIPFLERDYKLELKSKFKSNYLTAFVFGAAFAAGWTPCVGPVLGGIFVLAATSPGSAFTLLFSYSVGLGIPFLLVGLFASRATEFIRKYRGVFKYINILFGIVLIILGVLSFTQNLSKVANFDLLNQLILK